MKRLSIASIEAPRLKGNWIYVRGSIPKTIDNANLKTLSQLESNR